MEQMQFEDLSIDSAWEADIHTAGGWRKVAKAVFPAKYADSPKNAETHLRNCVNTNHAQKFNDEERNLICQMVREHGKVPMVIIYWCRELNLSIPEIINPEDEKAKLQRQYIECVGVMGEIAKRLEKLA